jgi:SAM-dependent methyltransferase
MAADLDGFRAESLAGWNEDAAGWGERHEWLFEKTLPVTAWLVEGLGVSPGQVILELAAGPGTLGLWIAGQVEPSSRVISSDFSPEMVRLAREKGERRRLTNVEYRVLDAERLDLADESVDGAVCRWGFMLMADPGAALEETRRVLRPAGRLAFVVWTTPDRNPWMTVPMGAAVEHGFLQPPDPARPGPFSLGSPDLLRALVARAGFSEPEIEELAFAFHYSDFDEFWESLVQLSGRFAGALASHSEPERDELRSLVAESLTPFRDDEGSYTLPASSLGVRATR